MDTKNPEALQKVVLAGMKLMYDEKSFKLFKNGISNTKVPLPERLAMETAGLMKMLMDKAQNRIPPDVLPAAAAMLLMEMAKFIKDAGIEDFTQEDIQKALQIMLKLMKQVFAGGQAPTPAPQQPPQQPQGMINQGVA